MTVTNTLVESEIDDRSVPPAVQLTRDETLANFDRRVRALLGIGSDEFYCRLDAGEYDEIADDVVEHPGLMALVMIGQYVR